MLVSLDRNAEEQHYLNPEVNISDSGLWLFHCAQDIHQSESAALAYLFLPTVSGSLLAEFVPAPQTSLLSKSLCRPGDDIPARSPSELHNAHYPPSVPVTTFPRRAVPGPAPSSCSGNL